MSDDAELRASRTRIAAAAAADRRHFERALHDGVQQDLLALSVEVQLLRRRLDDPALDDLHSAIHAALDRVRALADEIYPSVLDAQGLRGATRRYPPELEAAVALICRAADPDGRRTTIREEDGWLVVEAPATTSPTRARDLAEAAGATVTVDGALFRAAFPL